MSLTEGFVILLTRNAEIQTNRLIPNNCLKEFSLPKPFPMQLWSYVDHFLYQLSLPVEIIVTAFQLVEKIKTELTPYNLHRIVFTSLVLSYKFYTDVPVPNSALEKIGSLKQGELFKLETKLLELCEWDFALHQFESTTDMLIECSKIEKIEENQSESDQDTDFTEYSSCDSFSELSAFFSN